MVKVLEMVLIKVCLKLWQLLYIKLLFIIECVLHRSSQKGLLQLQVSEVVTLPYWLTDILLFSWEISRHIPSRVLNLISNRLPYLLPIRLPDWISE
jgi:hypothetical protein